MSLDPVHVVLGFALALAVGCLVGLERERRAQLEKQRGMGGARTFPIIALFGALLGYISAAVGPLVLAAGLVALAALIVPAYLQTSRAASDAQHGLTTEFAALLVFAIGALPFVDTPGLAFPERLLVAGALGTITMALLALREPIHDFAERLSKEDLIATVRFALIAVVALPLLPNRAFGPYEAFNPFRIGVVIVLIAGISFVGYVAVRLFGARRGFGVAAFFGGLVSSTAVTLSLAGRAKEHPALAPACALGITLASTVMFVRVLAEVAAVRPELVMPTAVPMVCMLACSALGCVLMWRRGTKSPSDGESKRLHNPFRLREALRLGLVYAVIRFVTAAAWSKLGSGGLLASAGISGVADVDAITLSVAGMHESGLDTRVAVAAITLAVVTNTLAKAALAAAIGGRRLAFGVAAVLVPTAAVGALVGVIGA